MPALLLALLLVIVLFVLGFAVVKFLIWSRSSSRSSG